MRRHLSNIFIIIFMLILINSCSKDENTVNPPSGVEVWSSSFEKNGFFSADGWTLPLNSDSSSDIPTGGGKYSLLLESNAPPEVFAEIRVPAMAQYSDYKFSFWSKSTGVTNDVYGKVILSLVRADTVVKSQSITIADISWRSYSIEDTFSVAANDSFMIQLSAGANQLLPGKTYFDLCKLEAME